MVNNQQRRIFPEVHSSSKAVTARRSEIPKCVDQLSEAGFTLIEIMVAMAILAGLSILIAQTLKTSFDSRAKIQADLNRESVVYDALRIMQNDIAGAFHYRDMMADTAPSPSPGQQPTPSATPSDFTAFVGEKESMYFTVFNHPRTQKDAPESDQAKVGYYLKDCNSVGGKSEKSKCLYRAVSPVLDNDVTKIEDGIVLVEHVDEFKLRYLGPGHDDFVESWKTGDKATEDITRLSFPYAVEITLVTLNKNNKKDKQFGATVLAPIRFPNNPTPTPGPNGATPAPATNGPDLNNLKGPDGFNKPNG